MPKFKTMPCCDNDTLYMVRIEEATIPKGYHLEQVEIEKQSGFIFSKYVSPGNELAYSIVADPKEGQLYYVEHSRLREPSLYRLMVGKDVIYHANVYWEDEKCYEISYRLPVAEFEIWEPKYIFR